MKGFTMMATIAVFCAAFAEGKTDVPAAGAASTNAVKQAAVVATIETSLGTIELELDRAKVPVTIKKVTVKD